MANNWNTLLLDMGNTRLKAARVDAAGGWLQASWALSPAPWRELADWLAAERVSGGEAWVSSVTTSARLSALQQTLAVAGVSLRSLYAGFQDFCDISPMQYLRNVRLERVRAELTAGPVSGGVASVALRWGFTHMGRFSAEYKAHFGESPSQTARKT